MRTFVRSLHCPPNRQAGCRTWCREVDALAPASCRELRRRHTDKLCGGTARCHVHTGRPGLRYQGERRVEPRCSGYTILLTLLEKPLVRQTNQCILSRRGECQKL